MITELQKCTNFR